MADFEHGFVPVEDCPLVTPFTRFMGIPDKRMQKLWAIRKKDPAEGPINIDLGDALREGVSLRNYQTQMVAHLMLMPRLIVGDAVGLGKAQPLDAKVLTPTGWVRMGDLKVGDAVVDPDGGVGFVEGVFPQGRKQVFRITTSDGGSAESCEEHLWTVQTINDRTRGGKFRTLTLKQIMAQGLQGKSTGSRGQWRRNNFFLPLPVPFESSFPPPPLVIPPYSLGLLLGDGGLRHSVYLTSSDPENIQRFREELPTGLVLRHSANYTWRVSKNSPSSLPNAYLEALRKLGLYGHYSQDKFIPQEYLNLPVEGRKALLAGLMDADGECSKDGLVYYHTSSPQLVKDITTLVRSLGGLVSCSSPRNKKFKHKGEVRVGRTSFILTLKTDFNPFRLARRAERWKPQMMARAIVAVEPSRETDCQCIQVSTKRNLYITDDYIVTHNTITAIAGMGYHIQRSPETKFIVLTTRSTTYQWRNEIVRFSGILRPYVLKDKYKNAPNNAQARLDQIRDFLKGTKRDVLIGKYSSLIGKRRKVEGDFDENGDRVYGGREQVSPEIRALEEVLKEHDGPVVLILDEAHKFKTTTSQMRTLVMTMARHSSRVWAMTATAIKNSLEEFYSIASAIGIRPMGSMSNFRDECCVYRQVHVGRGIRKPTLVGYRRVKDFKTAMRPFFYGRSQAQVKEPLPRLTTVFHQIDLNDYQTRLLLEDIPNGDFVLPPVVKMVMGEVELVDRDPSNMMTALSVNQLVANHPCLLDPSDGRKFFTKALSPKEDVLLDLLDGELKGENVIVFSKYRTWINRLQHITVEGHFTERKILRITGSENEKQRENARLKFQDPANDYDCIFINSAAIEGVNLQQAAHMVVLDVPWSWGDMQQLVGRMVRMASPHTACTLHVIVARGTIDEYAVETLRSKKGVFEIILGESFSQGILEENQEVDLTSGLDDLTQDHNDFKHMLQAHAKPLKLGTFVFGDILSATKSGKRKHTLIDKEAAHSNRSEKVSLKKLEADWGVESI